MNIEITKAGGDDLRYVQDLSERVLPDTFYGVLTTEQIDYMLDKLYSQDAIRQEHDRDDHRYLIARADGERSGYALIIRQGPDLFFLPKIYVEENRRSRGVGTALIRRVIALVRESHPGPFTIEVKLNRHNRARAFYAKLGFVKIREEMTEIAEDIAISQEVFALTV